MQKDNKFTAFWMDTTTAPWTPLTGLSATILIKLAIYPYTVVVNNEPMTDIGNGDYIYIFDGYSSEQDYIYHCSPWATAFIQNGQTDSRQDYLDKSITEIAVWWNPYITGIGGIQKWIQKIVDKVEEKWNEVIKEIEESKDEIIKSIPEQKEPIVNITTEKIDTKEFLKAIKEIKPEVNITTETIDNAPILTAIEKIGKLSDIKIPEYREPKEVNLWPIQEVLNEVKMKINEDSTKIDAIEDYVEMKIEEDMKENEENKQKEKEIEEEENLKRPIPDSFTAKLN